MATGHGLLQKARTRLGDAYQLGVVVPKNNAKWLGPWDCAEFASWCVFQTAGRLYGCSNNHGDPAKADAFTGFWQRDASAIGRTVSVAIAAQTPGAAIVRFPQSALIGHIVFADGKGGTVEAHSTARGLTASTLAGRRWDIGVLVPGIAYTQDAAPVIVAPPVLVLRLATPLTRGAIVRDLQKALKAAGVHPGAIDGIYGSQTVAAVNAFQILQGLVPDGEVGPETAAALGIAFPT